MMIFPIYKYDNKAAVKLTLVQVRALEDLKSKIAAGILKLVQNACLCENENAEKDIVVTEKDRYGLPIKSILCIKCGLIRSEKIFDNDSIIKFYSDSYRDIYTTKDSNGSPSVFFEEQKKRGAYLFKLFTQGTNAGNNLRVFEIGCGAGGILHAFQKNNNYCSGADYDEDYLQYGKKMGIDLIYGDYNSLVSDHSVDVIILSHVLEHFVHPIQEMQKVIRKVREDGYLIIEVPGIFKIDKSYFDPILYFQNAHVYSFYREYLNVLFATLGLEIVHGDEICIFILRKPKNWKWQNITKVYNIGLALYPTKIKNYIWRTYLTFLFKLNPYMWKFILSSVLKKLINK